MARKPMVTRTIKTLECNVMCLDVTHGEPFNKLVSVVRPPKDETKLLNKIKEIVDTESVKAVHIVDREEKATLYGIPEQDFIALAKPLLEDDSETYETEETEIEE